MIVQIITKVLAVIVIIIALFCNESSGQLPNIPCPDLFRYETEGNTTFGVLTLKSVKVGLVKTLVKFTIPGSVTLDYYGNIQSTQIGHGGCCYSGDTLPITYKIDFPRITDVPQLFDISINDVNICSGPKGPDPTTSFALLHDLTLISATPKPEGSSEITTTTTAIPPANFDVLNYIYSICGQENRVHANALAVHGQNIDVSRYPWIVAIYKKTVDSLNFKCGGSLISRRTVISAAHCFKDGLESIPTGNLLLSFGRHNLTEWENAINIGVQKLIIHPDFRKRPITYDADVAVVHLLRSVTFSPSIRPICLWQGPSYDYIIDGSTGSIVGWGEDEHHKGITTVPKIVNATIVSESTCIRSNEQLYYLTSNRTLCAGNRDGSGPCKGDSGSGLMIRNGTRWTLRGIVSASLADENRNCNLDEFAVFADIAKFVDWITSNMIT